MGVLNKLYVELIESILAKWDIYLCTCPIFL